ncbi:hypothetical protein Rhopal_003956-T1 [Rhodotorula paludigena]|uniref:Uncharacterized protein n=1 Tax=Rhodotorula paludigena TaxID=86838 RepID=A0AAV5GNJ9_9BASI|nr:hypothetical protein Rhopal_003956-T1 [Rhodotorula paludigena]
MPHLSESGARILARFKAQGDRLEDAAFLAFYGAVWGQENGVSRDGQTLVRTTFSDRIRVPILVRKEYRLLAAALDEHIDGTRVDHRDTTAFMIVGHPGVGTSLSVHYLLSRRMEEKKPVLYAETGDTSFVLFCEEGVYVDVPFTKLCKLGLRQPTPLFLDAFEDAYPLPGAAYSSITNLVTVFPTSPAPARYALLEKYVYVVDWWVMDLWRDDELAYWIMLMEKEDFKKPYPVRLATAPGKVVSLHQEKPAPGQPPDSVNPHYTARDCFRVLGRIPDRALPAMRHNVLKTQGLEDPVADLLPKLLPETVLSGVATYQQFVSQLAAGPARVLVEIPDPRVPRPSRAPGAPYTLVVSPSEQVSRWLSEAVQHWPLQTQQKYAAQLVQHPDIFSVVFKPYVLKYIAANGIKLEPRRGLKIPQVSHQLPVFDIKLPAATASFAADGWIRYRDVTSASTPFRVSNKQLSDGLYTPQPGSAALDAIMIFTKRTASSRATYCVALQVTTAATHDVVKDGLVRMLFALGPYAAKVNLVHAFISFDRDRGKKLADAEHPELKPVSSSSTPSLTKFSDTRLKKDNPPFTWTHAYGVVDPVFNDTEGTVTASRKCPELLNMDLTQ